MLEKLREVGWPGALVITGVLICITSILLWAPPDVRAQLLSANGVIWTIVGILTNGTKPPEDE